MNFSTNGSLVALAVLLAGVAGMADAGEAGAKGADPKSAPRAGPPLPAKEKFHIFLLAGQSNMLGVAKMEPEDKLAPPRVLTLNGNDEWVPAADPLHRHLNGAAGVCLGRTFGLTVAERDPSIVVGLIPCAVGGTSVLEWNAKSTYYVDAIRRVRLAQQQGVLKGILWHQGEQDSQPGGAPQKYGENLKELMERFRTDLKAPQLPFLVGQLGLFLTRPGRDTVNAALKKVPELNPHTAFVSAEGLKDNGDQTHFDAASTRELGRRFAKTYLELIKK